MTETEYTTTMQAELQTMDDALASGTVSTGDSLERELGELALALRAESAEAAPGFEAELRARVQEGFPRERRLPRPGKGSLQRLHLPALPRLRRPPLPVLGGVASALVAIAVAVSLSGGGEDGGTPVQDAVRPSADSGDTTKQLGRPADEAAPRARESAPAVGIAPPLPPGRGGFAPGARERRIERSASLTLGAPGDRLDRVADQINRLTDRYNGFVLRSSLSSGDEGTTGGDFELRIPSERLQNAITDLSKLGDVRARTQNGEDVTPQFVSAEERLQGARAERRSLLRRLERATSDAAAESIRRRLDLNAGETRGLRATVRELRTRTNYAAVTVTLKAEEGDEGGSSPEPGDGLGGATDDALESLSDSVELAIRVLGVMLPLGLLAGGLLLGARTFRRRRREAALGS